MHALHILYERMSTLTIAIIWPIPSTLFHFIQDSDLDLHAAL